MDIKIIVAAHKPYQMPTDSIYLPVHAGRALSPAQNPVLTGYAGDDTGENISFKNKNYCELTALYWAWKNLEYDCLGIVHYRRHFRGKSGKKFDGVLSGKKAAELLEQYPVILPKKRNYYIETTYDQYVHAHNQQDLDKAVEIIRDNYPDYLPAWDKVMNSTAGHRFNMFIMRKDLADGYLEWMFDILLRLEDVLDISAYSDYDKRVFGFVSERLLDVWLVTNNISYTELPVINMESQNWPKKIINFLKRKFIGK